ncbi:MAG: serine/threonine-protein kinase [Planctomycetota bacterium]|nr:serine/threonine-protein kinase [Planctomycetota bacterium]
MNRPTEGNDLTNQVIGGYSILHRLGVGGMSEVYLAFQNSLHRHVALKVLRADFVGSEEHEQRFLQEARSVASLIHPNIVQVYDVGKFDSTLYIAQEYVPGSNLNSFIQRRGALPIEEAVSILWQATSALQKAASIGLVHRDIKPDNLLLTPDGEAKVADFGLARARGKNQNLTAVGVALGTPLYMSPEQVQGQSVDSRSDLYSLGATAYHMLSGRPPFSGDTALALAMQHIQAQAVPLDQLRPDLPEQLVLIVHRLLKKSPEDRFGSAMELARELRSFIEVNLEGRGDKMIPFSGLVIEHQAISSSSATEELQILMMGRNSSLTEGSTEGSTKGSTKGKPRQSAWIRNSILWFGVPLVLTSALAFLLGRVDPFAHQSTSTAGVVRESSIQRQFALALVENNLKHWNAVSEFFPPTDALSRNYYLKSQIQIARLRIEGDDLPGAEPNLRTVIESPYSDELLRCIARIELGWIQQRGQRQPSGEEIRNENYARAMREMSTMIPEKQRLIRDALPARVRAEWETVDYLYQAESKPLGAAASGD